MNIAGLQLDKHEMRCNGPTFPLTPPQEENFSDHSSHGSDSPSRDKIVSGDCRSSVIHSVRSGITSGMSSRTSFPTVCLSPESRASRGSVSPQYSSQSHTTQEENRLSSVHTSEQLCFNLTPLQTTDFHDSKSRFDSSYGVSSYLASLPSDVPYKSYFSERFSNSSDIPRPFKNYAKKYIASLRESEEFLRFKQMMMIRMQMSNSTKTSDEGSDRISTSSLTEEEEFLEGKTNEVLDGKEAKSPGYWERRRKNNVAAKKSRDLRRQKEDELAIFAAFLDQENEKLREENMEMLKRCKYLEKCLQLNEQPLVPAEFESCATTFNYSSCTGLNEDYMEEYLMSH